jgi:hypothetical protein
MSHKLNLLRRARRLWMSNTLHDRRTNRRNAIEWARKVHALGTRWVLHPANAPTFKPKQGDQV